MITLASDLGGTRIKLGVVRDGRVLSQTSIAANSKAGLRPRIPEIKAAWLALLKKAKLQIPDCDGISVSFPSVIDAESGRVLDAFGKYADAMEVDFRAWAKTEFNLPLVIDNDARMALAGEWKYGAGRGCDNLVMITLGTGLGTAAVIGGRLLRGCHGQAGVLGGHLTVRHDGRYCSCGNVGCAEAEASTSSLCDLAVHLREWDYSSLRRLATINYGAVFKHAAQGDPCAIKLTEQSLGVWSALAVSLIHAYDPEILILGGGIMKARELILPVLGAFVRRHAHTPWGKVRVIPGELGDAAALLAGEWLLCEQRPAAQ